MHRNVSYVYRSLFALTPHDYLGVAAGSLVETSQQARFQKRPMPLCQTFPLETCRKGAGAILRQKRSMRQPCC